MEQLIRKFLLFINQKLVQSFLLSTLKGLLTTRFDITRFIEQGNNEIFNQHAATERNPLFLTCSNSFKRVRRANCAVSV